MSVSGAQWDDNHKQFARLIAEIAASGGLSNKQLTALSESMDLDLDQLDELFDRAQCEWDLRVKSGKSCLKVTPAKDLKNWGAL